MDAQLIRGRDDDFTAGFSLVELLIVVAILSILSVTAGLSVSRLVANTPSDRSQFMALDVALRHDALMRRQTQQIDVSDRGFRRLAPGADQPDETLWNHAPDWITPEETGQPIVYLPDGRSTPMTLDFREAGLIIRCVSDGWSGLTCDAR